MRLRLVRGAVAVPLAALALTVLPVAQPSAAASRAALSGSSAPATPVTDPASYVDPLIGTGRGGSTVGEINNFPGPAAPFGMMQFSPDTRGSYAGYQYHSDRIRGFSLDHASVGCSAFGDVPLLPVTGPVGPAPWSRTERFSHQTERAKPGYYAVTLQDSAVRAELTATTRTGLATFTFPRGRQAQVLVKGGGSLAGDTRADIRVLGDREVTGSATTGRFCGQDNEYTVYYAITFDRPFTTHGTWDGAVVSPGSDAEDAPAAGAYLSFGTEAETTVRAKVSMSFVSVAGARANMAAEVPGWDQEAVRLGTRERWNAALRRITVTARDTGLLTTFYTNLYRSLLHPNTFNDADGRYIGFDDEIRTLPPGHTQYANFSDWDTYRSLAPLHALLWRDEASDMAQSLVNDATQGGWWPRWPLANDYTGVMTGDNSVPLIADLYAFGARDFDLPTALAYLVKGATTVDHTPGAYRERPGVEQYVARGYAPNNDVARGGHQRSGASITLEWAIDDFAISRLAAAAGDHDTAQEFARRGQNWQHLLNPATDYLQPRGEDGRFPDGPGFRPPPPGRFGQDGFEEGNAAQYAWLVPQNIAGLVTAMGGRDAAAKRLDAFFTELNAGPNEPRMWAGNEVCFGVPWVFNHLGRPWRTQETVREIATTLFSPTPDGEPGNDDLGAQSSWYVWAALGLYPSAPGTPDLAVHSPLFERAVLDLPGPEDLDIRAPQASATTPYVHGLTLDGRPWDRSYLPGETITGGGRLDFTLAEQPDTEWATGADAAPPSYRDGEAPFLASATRDLTTVVPGAGGGTVTVDAQRLGGSASELRVTASPAPGLRVSPATSLLRLDSATGSGALDLEVSAAPGTAEGYHEVPITVREGTIGKPVRLSATVLVARKDSLPAAYGNIGSSSDTDRSSGDFDGGGSSYSRQALAAAGLAPGARVEVSGTSFTWPAAPAGRPDNTVAAGQTLALPAEARAARRLVFIGSATHGDQEGRATVTFSDGSTARADLSFGDWTLPGGGSGPLPGNTVVARTDHRNEHSGSGPAAYVFATEPFVVPAGKMIATVTLPSNSNLHVFAIGLG